MANKDLLTALLRLCAPWYISRIDVDIASEEAHVTIDRHPGKLPCATCGKACLVEDHSDERVIRHLDMWQAKAFLHVAMPRTRCPEHGVLRVALPFAEPGSRFFMAFEERTIATVTNGLQEGMNAKLMSVIRAGRGYRHHETFRMAARFFLGGLGMTPRCCHAWSFPL